MSASNYFYHNTPMVIRVIVDCELHLIESGNIHYHCYLDITIYIKSLARILCFEINYSKPK